MEYSEEVLIRQNTWPLEPVSPVPLRLYLDHNPDKATLLNRLGRSVVRISADIRDDYRGSGFLARFCLANDDEFYALVSNEHIIDMETVRSGEQFYIFSELLQREYQVELSNCPFALCSPLNDRDRITRILESGHRARTLPLIVGFEEHGPHLDVTVIELYQELVERIHRDNFIHIDASQNSTSATQRDQIFVLQYPLSENVVLGIPRYLCISTGEVGNRYENDFFMHTADTERYASGSPVLRWDGTVCGVHRGGAQRDDAQGRPDDFNLAAIMDAVLERLQAVRSQNP